MKKYILLVWYAILVVSMLNAGETGKPFMTFFTPSQTGGHNQNWAFIQDDRGVMYVGNGWGVQEFDGSVWRMIRISNGSVARSFAKDSTGRIYVGSATELGYLEADTNNIVQYKSLLNRIPQADRSFNFVWSINPTPDGIFFQSRERIFRFQQSPAAPEEWQVKIWRPENPGNYFIHSYYLNGILYTMQRGIGLLKMSGDSLELLPGSEQFVNDRLPVMLPFPGRPGIILLGSMSRGLFIYDSEGFHPFLTEADSVLKQGTLYDGIVLPDGSFAFCTLSRGFLIIGADGKIKMHLTEESGLLSNTVATVYFDRHKNIWLGMARGIGIIEYESGLSQFPFASGGVPFDLCRHQGILYASATDGIYYLSDKTSGFEWVAGMRNSGSSNCLKVDGHLYAANVAGIHLIQGAKSRLVLPYSAASPSFVCLHRCKTDSCRILAGAINGLAAVKYDPQNPGRLKIESIIQGVHEYIRQIVEVTPGVFWLSTYNAGIIRLHFSDNDLSHPVIEKFGASQNLPSGITSVYEVAGSLVFGTEKGIFRFDEKEGKFLPDPVFKTLGLGINPGECTVAADRNHNIWVNAGKGTTFYRKMADGSYQMENSYASLFSREFVYTIYPENSSVWFGTTNGVIRYMSGRDTLQHQAFPALIRCLKFPGDSVMYTNSYSQEEQKHQNIDLTYKLNAITFEYTALSFFKQEENEFQIFLEGYDRDWSEWARDTKHNYTNLAPGDYVFRVRARNLYGEQSEEASLAFTILAPWYATWFAYMGYLLLAITSVYGIIRYRTRKIRKHARELEKIVEQRTVQIQAQKNNVEQLSRMGRDITASLSIENIISTVYANINTLMDASVFGIGLYNSGDHSLDFPSTIENHQALEPFSLSLSDENHPAAKCFNHREEVIINNCQADYTVCIGKQAHSNSAERPGSVIYLPLWSKEKITGVITTQSFNKNAYSDYQVNILRNLATYSAIALENAESYRKLSDLLDELKATQNKLVTQSKLAALGSLTAGIAHEIKNPLNFINNFASLVAERLEELREQLNQEKANPGTGAVAEIEYLLNNLKQCAVKILDHGKRADNIVRNMLQHSQTGSGQREPCDINVLLEEALTLTYHGLHARDMRFDITIEKSFDQSIGLIEVIPQEISRAFLNIIGNGCYEAHRKMMESEGPFIPLLSVVTQKSGKQVKISIRDNGNGIPEKNRTRIFTPFFTTKPAGQGTGLGLSIAWDIIVHQHRGQISFETEEGSYTEFNIFLPL